MEHAYGEAWKLQEFGPRIVFQRDVNKNSANTLQLRNEDGKLLKSGKEATVEGESIRSHFNIALNNPTTVLQQEQAKMFFANHDPEGMYKMIMDGTQIANAIQGYTKASNDAKSTKEKVEKYMKELYAQQAKLDRVMEKQNRDKEENQLNQARILELHPKVIWGKYQQAKREKKGHEASLGPLDQEITGAMAKLVQAQKKVSDEQKSILGLEDSAAGMLANAINFRLHLHEKVICQVVAVYFFCQPRIGMVLEWVGMLLFFFWGNLAFRLTSGPLDPLYNILHIDTSGPRIFGRGW